ncbi:hypothetical protein ACIBI3_11020 [Actinomadura luteofluorescens]|uniref:hypothetical protein n=1 Tax=Actinomadura luteofluorescens TaxID=46163 RepID=UPI00379FCC74
MAEFRGSCGKELGISPNPLTEFPVTDVRDRVQTGHHVDVIVPVHQREGHARILAGCGTARTAFPVFERRKDSSLMVFAEFIRRAIR